MRTTIVVATIGLGAAAAVPWMTSPTAAAGPGGGITGTWLVAVDPDPNPGGDPPPFESVLSFGEGREVVEATSRSANPPDAPAAGFTMSAGLGSWQRTGPSTYRFTVQKYRFDATGAYVGKTVITENVTVTGASSYTGTAVTRLFLPSGQPAAQFTSTSRGERLTP